jgi:hypothetical protein
MIGFPVAFGPVVRQHIMVRIIWGSKAALLMARMQKRDKEQTRALQSLLKAWLHDQKTSHYAPTLAYSAPSQ